MQLLPIDLSSDYGQADPYILAHDGTFYIYTTGKDGVYAYSSKALLTGWKPEGRVFTLPDREHFWAPSVIALDGTFYLYCSFEDYEDTPDAGGHHQAMYVAKSDSPTGPFREAKRLFHPFSIDSHIVKTGAGLFLFYSTNTFAGERIGTYIVVQKMKDPYTPEGEPVPVLTASLDEEIFRRDRYRKGQHWHTLEGAYWFSDGDWQYLMYSGSCYENETYFVGYAAAKTKEQDLRKVHFRKMPDESTWAPLLWRNAFEEGTGHNSVMQLDGEWYCVYHARSIVPDGLSGDRRTARICKMRVKDGSITLERYQDKV